MEHSKTVQEKFKEIQGIQGLLATQSQIITALLFIIFFVFFATQCLCDLF